VRVVGSDWWLVVIFIFICIFFFPLTSTCANERDNTPFIDLLKDMHQQIGKWKTELKEMENDPSIPLVKKEVIKTIRAFLESIDKVLKEWLPPEPKIKKTRSFRQKFPRYALPLVFPNSFLTG
jgi:hypothetical protein